MFGNASALDLKFVASKDLCAELPEEPSGLALSHDHNSLWTVSDNSKWVFRIDFDGQPLECFDIDVSGLEGIALNDTGSVLYAVSEPNNEIIRIDVKSRKTSQKMLKEMNGWEIVEKEFRNSHKNNKGLEGITFRPGAADAKPVLFVLKEGEPRLLIEISEDPWTIVAKTELEDGKWGNAENADVSGVDYDPSRNAFWIVSDKERKLYLYDLDDDKVKDEFTLEYEDGQRVDKAEGVALDPNTSRIYVVSDSKARLFAFELQ